jgi:hypothetical protein
MPLDRDHPPVVILALNRLDDSIGSARGYSQSRCGIEYALMMKRVDRDPRLADRPSDARSRLYGYVVRPDVTNIVRTFGVVRQGAGHAGHDVLNESASERDVQQLRTAADCKNRFAGLARGEYESYFSLVAAAVHGAQSLVRQLTVQRGIDVFASSEYETVSCGDYTASGGNVREWRNDERYEPC